MAENQNYRHIVRVVNTDLDGSKNLISTLRKIKGVNFMFANLACNLTGISKEKKTGDLSDKEVEKLNDVLKNPSKFKVPVWMLNRRKDPEEGEDSHLLSTDVKFIKDNDIKQLKKIKCYKGIRHMQNLPVRGQGTKAHFRKKGKNKALGVKKKSSGKKAGK